MALLALKIDVDTYRGTVDGVPRLVRLLQKYGARASFLFSLGPDHTGWALRRALRPGFLKKVARTSVLEHYGIKTLLYGVLLPAPDIGKACAAQMRAVKDAGFECGIHTWDHVLWQDHVRQRDAVWTIGQMQKSVARFTQIFGAAPPTHGAAGWQMNAQAFAHLDDLGIRYASDSRCRLAENGTLVDIEAGPHRLSVAGKTLNCVQLPTTLPTLDELLGRRIDGVLVDASNVTGRILALTAALRDHVFTLHAELEGQKLAGAFEDLLKGWLSQGYELVSMAEYYKKISQLVLPTFPLSWGEIPGRAGQLVVQAESRLQTAATVPD
ncbi:peptidoglycan/xylan/chitin deacetylase (PgdA/CDA1 family) [Paucimonas lemoignei]|uniref:Peptidoglycan/xylan/chitin deacetylase (PgdA/CDA1 family) n=1 Tax=Paucimonas lemoignei TaxID=29443 RepID=A0A4R3I112_PAULE|nr:polysaccharide deacetylase family protein [Paucimonas lemoignei]TCS39407.1 peptidoglycan/xylan/chitin deacetylase (PgdA/CDA1 family) [Paucimonas lemoignei]